MENIQTVLFDLDETLLDRTKSFLFYCEYLIDKFFPQAISVEKRREIVDYLVEKDNGGYGDRAAFHEDAVMHLHFPCTADGLREIWFRHFDEFAAEEDGMKEVLEYLSKKYKLGLITNGSTDVQNAKIDALGIRHYFEIILVSEAAGISKPEKEIFLMACRELGIEPENAVYIGDHYENDYLGASQAGLHAIWKKKEDKLISLFELL